MIENIIELTPFIRPFPDASDVFCEPVLKYAKYIHPLASIDLSSINSEWKGWIHFVDPIEPCEGCIGDLTTQYHNEYLRSNWIAFKIEDGKYRLLGDFRYFFLENPPNDNESESHTEMRLDLEEHYEKERACYEQKKAIFLKHGYLYNHWAQQQPDGTYKPEDRITFIEQLGGKSDGGNWAGYSDSVLTIDQSDEDDSRPLTKDGRRYEFIGYICGYNYRYSSADATLLFYDPVEEIALITFEYG